MTLTLMEDSQQLVITLDQIKAHLRLDGDHDNEILTTFIHTATEMVEGFLGMTVTNRVWKLVDTPNHEGQIHLPMGPVQEIISIDKAGPVKIVGDVVHCCIGTKPVTVIYRAGMTSVPAPVRQAIRVLTGHFYENRLGDLEFPVWVRGMLMPYRSCCVR